MKAHFWTKKEISSHPPIKKKISYRLNITRALHQSPVTEKISIPRGCCLVDAWAPCIFNKASHFLHNRHYSNPLQYLHILAVPTQACTNTRTRLWQKSPFFSWSSARAPRAGRELNESNWCVCVCVRTSVYLSTWVCSSYENTFLAGCVVLISSLRFPSNQSSLTSMLSAGSRLKRTLFTHIDAYAHRHTRVEQLRPTYPLTASCCLQIPSSKPHCNWTYHWFS